MYATSFIVELETRLYQGSMRKFLVTEHHAKLSKHIFQSIRKQWSKFACYQVESFCILGKIKQEFEQVCHFSKLQWFTKPEVIK